MNDQAEILRKKLKEREAGTSVRTLAVVSGKGGVGKSNFALNFSLELVNKGHSVLLFDLDIGMGNIEILSGTSPMYTIADFFSESPVPLKEMITQLPGGIHFIAGGTGLAKMPVIHKSSVAAFTAELAALLNEYEYIIFDMSAGLNETSLRFILTVDEVVVLTTPEPTSITDAYSVMKYITLENKEMPFYLIINRAHNHKEGIETFSRMANVLKHFLEKDIILLGVVPEDDTIEKAVKRQIPFIQYNTKAPSSRAVSLITERFCQQEFTTFHGAKQLNFITRLKQFLFNR